jgi:hypothetical protein
VPLGQGAAARIALLTLQLEDASRRAGASLERERILTIMSRMVWNPAYWGADVVPHIERAVAMLVDRICDEKEGVNPFPTNEALLLVDPGGPWEAASYTPAPKHEDPL